MKLRPYEKGWRCLEEDAEFKSALEKYCNQGKVRAVGVIADSTIKPSINPYRLTDEQKGHYLIVGMEWLLWHKRWHHFIAKAILMS